MNAAADRRGEQFHGLGTADGADVVEIPGPDDNCVVRRQLSYLAHADSLFQILLCGKRLLLRVPFQ